MDNQTFNSTKQEDGNSNQNLTASYMDRITEHIVKRFPFLSSNPINESSLTCEISEDFLLYCLLPSAFILLLLSFVEHRKKIYSFEKRFPCVSGRFGIVVPLDFTSSLENRWSYAFAFAAVTPLIFSLFFGFTNPFKFTLPQYLQVFVYLVAAFEVGFICMPIFACLSTSHHLLGGFLGLLYTLAWFIVQLWVSVWCTSGDDKESFVGFAMQYEWLFDIPHLLSLGFLLFRFAFMIMKDVQIRLKKCSKQNEVKKHHYRYVQRLLTHPPEVSVKKSWFQKNVYEWDPYFKFPNRIIATVVLSFLGSYMIVLTEQIISSWLIMTLYGPWRSSINIFVNESSWILHLDYGTYTWYITSACAMLSSVIHVSHVLMYYRKHIKSLWAGDKKYLAKKCNLRPAVSVAGLLKYPGYQIAFTMWGYLIIHMAMFTAGMVFVYLVILPICEDGFLSWLLKLLTFLTNFFILFTLMKFQIIVIRLCFLQDKNLPQDKEKPLALKNRKAFHNFNYFLFFFNVILGLGNCVLRLIKSSLVALMLLTRIERTIMPQGFKKLDTSHSTWVGMIITDHHHCNPVLVCFCHLLIKHTLQRVCVDEGVKLESPAKQHAHLRWLLVYTLLRNPKLILLRKRRCLLNREEFELAFIWAMTTCGGKKHTPGSLKSAQLLISALHGSSIASEIWWEGLRRTCPT